MNDSRPPILALSFLRWYCDPDQLEDLEGALFEYYFERSDSESSRRANFYFWLDVVMHCRPHVWKGIKRQNSINMLGNHLRVSWRSLRKYKLNTTLNTIGLGTGLASFFIIMLWVNQELAFDQFHEKKDRIYRISNTFRSEAETFSQAPSGPALGAQLHKIFSEIENGARYYGTTEQIRIGDKVFFERNIGVVDPNFMDIFTFPVIKGDPKALEKPFTILVTETNAKRLFDNADPIGQAIKFGEHTFEVAGVIKDVPETSQVQFNSLISIESMRKVAGSESFDDIWGGGWFQTYLLLEEDVEVSQLEADITAFIGEKLTDWAERGMYYEYFLQPVTSIHLDSNLRYDFGRNMDRSIINVFRIVAIVILLIACINYVNIATANAINRAKEVSIRKVIGSSRKLIVNQFLTESVLVLFGSVALAFGISYFLLPQVGELSGYTHFNVWDLQNLIWLGIVLLVCVFFAGAIPAMAISGFPMLSAFRGTSEKTIYGVIRKSLVVFQFSATVILLIGMVVVNAQMRHIQNQSLGMKVDEVLHVNFRGVSEVASQSQVLYNELKQLPHVKEVSFLSGGYPVNGLSNSTVDVQTAEGNYVTSSIYTMRVDEQFSETFGINLIAGRFFSPDFPTDSTQSVVINESAVRNFGWESPEEAIGKKMGRDEGERTIIGVAGDFNFEALYRKVEPVRILPARGGDFNTLAIRVDPKDVVASIEQIQATWDDVIPTVPMDLSLMSDDIRRQYIKEYSFKSVFSGFSILAIIIGCLGLFGLVTASVNRRMKELSIRKVLGASIASIMLSINLRFIKLILISLIIAGPIAWWMLDQWLEMYSYRIDVTVGHLALAAGLTLLITSITISTNALKTARTNPAKVLKDE